MKTLKLILLSLGLVLASSSAMAHRGYAHHGYYGYWHHDQCYRHHHHGCQRRYYRRHHHHHHHRHYRYRDFYSCCGGW